MRQSDPHTVFMLSVYTDQIAVRIIEGREQIIRQGRVLDLLHAFGEI